jgi:hypothetical protein
MNKFYSQEGFMININDNNSNHDVYLKLVQDFSIYELQIIYETVHTERNITNFENCNEITLIEMMYHIVDVVKNHPDTVSVPMDIDTDTDTVLETPEDEIVPETIDFEDVEDALEPDTRQAQTPPGSPPGSPPPLIEIDQEAEEEDGENNGGTVYNYYYDNNGDIYYYDDSVNPPNPTLLIPDSISIPTNSILDSNLIPPNSIPPNSIPPNSIPPNSIPPNSIPPNSIPPIPNEDEVQFIENIYFYDNVNNNNGWAIGNTDNNNHTDNQQIDYYDLQTSFERDENSLQIILNSSILVTPIQEYPISDEDSCCICYEKYLKHNVIKTNCNHFFCYTCVTEFTKNKKQCPMCRAYILNLNIHVENLLPTI